MSPNRSPLTRLLHLGLLLVVAHQVVSSLVMHKPAFGQAPGWPHFLHERAGLVGLAILVAFWAWTLVRDRAETPLARLVPWFSAARRAEFVADVARLVGALGARRVPPLDLEALAGAVHGLGLLVASFLASTGAAWFFFLAGTPYGRVAMGMHSLSAKLMWAYLIGHALVALAHQALGDDVFSRMFRARPRAPHKTVAAE